MPDKLPTRGANTVIADQGLMYWRNPATGHVFAADATDSEYAKRVKRGFQPLDQYGQFSSSAYYLDHPHEPLFQSGGAVELTPAELLELGYAQRPPLVPTCGQHVGQGGTHLNHQPSCWAGAKPAQFPQLKGRAIPPLRACDQCDRADLTEEAWAQHTAIMHTENRREEALSRAILKGLKKGGANTGTGLGADEIAALVVATMQAFESARTARTEIRTSREEPEPEPPPEEEEEEEAEEEEDEGVPDEPPDPEPDTGFVGEYAPEAARSFGHYLSETLT